MQCKGGNQERSPRSKINTFAAAHVEEPYAFWRKVSKTKIEPLEPKLTQKQIQHNNICIIHAGIKDMHVFNNFKNIYILHVLSMPTFQKCFTKPLFYY